MRRAEQGHSAHLWRWRDTRTWLEVLDEVAALNVAHVLPDHSPPGDGSLVCAERQLVATIRTQALALKRLGTPVSRRVLYFLCPGADRLVVEFPEMLADGVGILGIGHHGVYHHNTGDVHALLLQGFE